VILIIFDYCLYYTTDTNLALHFYSHDNAKTEEGVLRITTERKENAYRAFNEKTKKFYADKKYIQSAMMQSWNKFCFTGGIVEFSAKLPGSPRIGGLWPACKLNRLFSFGWF
jgi:beta-glucanase (GH16 family)